MRGQEREVRKGEREREGSGEGERKKERVKKGIPTVR